jgi:tetratricopeptide (TPR) repeat protein
MDRFSGLVATSVATSVSLALVQPHAVAQSYQQVEAIARQVTVQIDGQNPGSGVIVAREGQTYFVLTAAHVVATADEYNVVTPDLRTFPIDYRQVRKFHGVDLALVPFTSSLTYQVVEIGSSSQVQDMTPAYIAGFPHLGTQSTQTRYQLSPGEVMAQSSRPLSNGYALAYINTTFVGMSGGPILNQQGQLIGIHGTSKTPFAQNQGINPQTGRKAGLNLGMPIDTFLRLVPQVSPTLKFPAAPPLGTATQLNAADLFIQAAEQIIADNHKAARATLEQVIRLQPNYAAAYLARAEVKSHGRDIKGQIADLDRAIRLNPNFAVAYHHRGFNRQRSGDLQGAIADFDQAIRIDPNYADVYFARGLARSTLKDFHGAFADYDQAIRIDPNDALTYVNRGYVREKLGDFRGAFADYDQAIRINPNNAVAFNNRGFNRQRSGDLQGAFADYDQAIRIDPNYANTYINRGVARQHSGDFQGAASDFQRAADLAQAQGDRQAFELANNNLKNLRQ